MYVVASLGQLKQVPGRVATAASEAASEAAASAKSAIDAKVTVLMVEKSLTGCSGRWGIPGVLRGTWGLGKSRGELDPWDGGGGCSRRRR